MHNKWLHTWVLGVVSILLVAPIAGSIAWIVSKNLGFFWIVFWFYVGMGIICIIIDAINHVRTHRGLFTHSEGCYSLKFFKKEEENS